MEFSQSNQENQYDIEQVRTIIAEVESLEQDFQIHARDFDSLESDSDWSAFFTLTEPLLIPTEFEREFRKVDLNNHTHEIDIIISNRNTFISLVVDLRKACDKMKDYANALRERQKNAFDEQIDMLIKLLEGKMYDIANDISQEWGRIFDKKSQKIVKQFLEGRMSIDSFKECLEDLLQYPKVDEGYINSDSDEDDLADWWE